MANPGAGRRSKAGTGAEANKTEANRKNTRGAAGSPGRSARNTNGDGNNGNGNNGNGGKGTSGQPGAEGLGAAMSGLAGLLGQNGQGGSAILSDAIAQAVLLLLGSGPAVVAYQGLMSAQVANGRMFDQSVANQQRMNMLGMCTTAKCVRYMFDGGADEIDEVEDILKDPSNMWSS